MALYTALVFAGMMTGLILGIFIAKRLHASAEADWRRQTIEVEQERRELRIQLDDAVQELRHLEADQARLTADLQTSRALQEERLSTTDAVQQQLATQFQALSSASLDRNNQIFLDLAESVMTRFHEKSDTGLSQRTGEVQRLVGPLNERLEHLGRLVGDLEKRRDQAYQGMTLHMDQMRKSHEGLREQTEKLTRSLHASSGRGRWGEMQLRRAVQLAGLEHHSDFQTSVQTADGARPDLVISLPDGWQIVIDAKAPMDSAPEASDLDQEQKSKRMSRAIVQHIQQLGQRRYQDKVDRCLVVLMYLPSDNLTVLTTSMQNDIQDRAADAHLSIVTPLTLIALLRCIAQSWQVFAVSQDTRNILGEIRQLLSDMAEIDTIADKVARSLTQATRHHGELSGLLSGRISPSISRLEQSLSADTSLPTERSGS